MRLVCDIAQTALALGPRAVFEAISYTKRTTTIIFSLLWLHNRSVWQYVNENYVVLDNVNDTEVAPSHRNCDQSIYIRKFSERKKRP